MEYKKFMFWTDIFIGGLKFFVPMGILGGILGNVTTPKFLILGCHPVLLMGFIATIAVIICVIGLIVMTILEERN